MIEPRRCQQYKPDDILPIRPLNWDDTIDEDTDDVNWADPEVSSGGRSHPSDDNYIDDGEGQENMLRSQNGTRKGKGTTHNKG